MGVILPVQDNAREQHIVALFGLHALDGSDRDPVGHPDATDDLEHKFEVKSTSKDSVSTARDFSLDHCRRYRERYWIVGKFKNFASGAVFSDFWFLAPCHIDGWLSKMETAINDDLLLGAKVVQQLSKDEFGQQELKRLRYILSRGVRRNDPNVPLKYIEKHGILVDSDHAFTLKSLVCAYPIAQPSIEQSPSAEYFIFSM